MFIWLFILFNSVFAADMDYSFSSGVRTLPKSGGLSSNVGSSFLVWGKKEPENILYGYVRPYVYGATSVSVNQAQVALEVAPISFLTLTFGHMTSYRSKDFQDLPCATNRCQGNLITDDAKLHLVLGYRNWFLAFDRQLAWVSSADDSLNVLDENVMLLERGGSDSYHYSELALGFRINDNWSTGLDFYEAFVVWTGNTSEHASVFGRYKYDDQISLLGGIGTYISSLQERGLALYALVRWQGGKGLQLY